MPLLDDPNALVTYVLLHDRKKPEPRPAFICKAQTRRQVREIARQAEEIVKETDNDKAGTMMLDLLLSFIVGWKNVPAHDGTALEFTRDNFNDRLLDGELWELAHAAPLASTPNEADVRPLS